MYQGGVMLSNRCPRCGSIASHCITDTSGHRYYKCTTGLTTFYNGSRVPHIKECNSIIDEYGQLVAIGSKLTIVYKSGGEAPNMKLKSMVVADGHEVL
jgi:hypothetical protein